MKFFSVARIAVLLITIAASGKLVKASSSEYDDKIKVCFDSPKEWYTNVYAYVYRMEGYKSITVSSWPGLLMKKENYLDCLSFSKDYDEGYIIFTDTKRQVPGFPEKGFVIKANGLYDADGYKSSLDEVDIPDVASKEPMEITIKFYSEWNQTFVYLRTDEESWAYTYAVSMKECEKEDENNGCQIIDIRTPNTIPKVEMAFTDGKGEWVSDGDFVITESGNYVVKDGILSKSN